MVALFDEEPDTYRRKYARKKKEEPNPEYEMRTVLSKRLYQLSKGDYPKLIEEIENNRDFLKYHFSDDEREYFRSLCQASWRKADGLQTLEDLDLFDDVFGFYLPSDCNPEPMRKPRVERELRYYSNMAYDPFFHWVTHPDTFKALMSHPELKSKLEDQINTQKSNNIRRFEQVGYLPEHDEFYSKLLEMIV